MQLMLLIGRDPDPFFWKAGSRSVKKNILIPSRVPESFIAFTPKLTLKNLC